MTDSVPRETGDVPREAVDLFGDRMSLAERFAGLLAGPGIERGLLGPREAPRLWDRHLVNCAIVARALPARVTVADVGSGAGLPGLVMAIARPDLEVALIEPLLRRTVFLEEAVSALGVEEQVRVLRGRAEAFHGREEFDVVTARAVAPLVTLTGWCLPLVRPGGELWAIKGHRAAGELDEAGGAIAALGGSPVGIETYGADLAVSPTNVVRVRRSS